MLHIQGSPALSDFRLNKLLAELKSLVPTVSGLASHFVHFADISESLDEAESTILARLLQYGPNEIPRKKKTPPIVAFLKQFLSPLIYVVFDFLSH